MRVWMRWVPVAAVVLAGLGACGGSSYGSTQHALRTTCMDLQSGFQGLTSGSAGAGNSEKLLEDAVHAASHSGDPALKTALGSSKNFNLPAAQAECTAKGYVESTG